MENFFPVEYNNKTIRTINKNKEIWFVAKDICDVLEIANHRKTGRYLTQIKLAEMAEKIAHDINTFQIYLSMVHEINRRADALSIISHPFPETRIEEILKRQGK